MHLKDHRHARLVCKSILYFAAIPTRIVCRTRPIEVGIPGRHTWDIPKAAQKLPGVARNVGIPLPPKDKQSARYVSLRLREGQPPSRASACLAKSGRGGKSAAYLGDCTRETALLAGGATTSSSAREDTEGTACAGLCGGSSTARKPRASTREVSFPPSSKGSRSASRCSACGSWPSSAASHCSSDSACAACT